MMKKLKSKFLRVRCNKCSNEQVIFSNSSTIVNCLKCGEVLSKPTGGKASINTQVLEVL